MSSRLALLNCPNNYCRLAYYNCLILLLYHTKSSLQLIVSQYCTFIYFHSLQSFPHFYSQSVIFSTQISKIFSNKYRPQYPQYKSNNILTNFQTITQQCIESLLRLMLKQTLLLNYILYQIMNFETQYQVYQIGDSKNNYAITQAPPNSIYDANNSYRKARGLPLNLNQNRDIFIDDTFYLEIRENDVNENNNKFVARRIYQIYDKQFDIFTPELMQDIPLKPRKFYPTFLSEFSMIDKTYLQTLFITKKINKKGLYKYFVRRNGEYYVQFIDDWIPVDPQTRLPPWGLSQLEPWKIIMMKAWLKQKRLIAAMLNAEPYQFIHCFGFPGYRALSIKKQLNHLAVSSLKQTSKIAKEQRIPLEVPGFIVVGKTRNNSQVLQMGLVPNRAGYRITKAKFENQSILKSSFLNGNRNEIKQHIFKVVSSLPSAWVGQFSIFANGKIHTAQFNKLSQDITRIQSEFFATYQQISQVFSKFYMVPQYTSNKLSGNLIEDSIAIKYNNPNEYHVFELNVQSSGFINLNIDLPWDSAQVINQDGKSSRRYSYIKYFMAKREKAQNNLQLKAFSYYDGQYVKGYHKSCNRFLEIQPGNYYIYFKIEPNEYLYKEHIIAININSNAKIQNFVKVNPETVLFPEIMQAALHNYNTRYGLKTYVDRKSTEKSKNLVAHISNSFDQIGFGIISITARAPTDMMLAMNIHPENFQVKKLRIVEQAHQLRRRNINGPINIVVHQGQAKTVIVQRMFRSKQTFDAFPPPESVDFYHIM